MNRQIPEKGIQMANTLMTKCSTFLVTREMQDKTTMAYCFTPTMMATVIKKKN